MKHAIKIGGHKGVTKMYNRLRQDYLWPFSFGNAEEILYGYPVPVGWETGLYGTPPP